MKPHVAKVRQGPRAAIAAAAALLLAQPASAGDEDISPNAYQQFDPVTGFTITVDPDADKRQGHPPADAAIAEPAGQTPDRPAAGSGPRRAWLYALVLGIAAALYVARIRGRARSKGPL